MEIKRVSGRVIERSTVFVPANTRERTRRGRRKGGTTALKQDENERQGEKRLARILNCNFRPGDLSLTLTFDPDHWEKLGEEAEALEAQHPETGREDRLVMAAEHQAALWIGRIQRAMRKAGDRTLLRYVMVVSDMDGDTKESRRVHIHAVVPAWAGDYALAAWKAGLTDVHHLREQDDYTPLARYLLRQVRRRPDARKWRAAQNMDKPVVTVRDIPPGKILKAGKNQTVQHQNAIEPGQPQYLRVVDLGRKRPEVKAKVSGTRRRKQSGVS